MDTVVNLRFSNWPRLKYLGQKGLFGVGNFAAPSHGSVLFPDPLFKGPSDLEFNNIFLKRQTVYHKLIMSVIISLFAALLVGINLIFSRLPNDYQCFKINQLNCVLHSLVIISAAVT